MEFHLKHFLNCMPWRALTQSHLPVQCFLPPVKNSTSLIKLFLFYSDYLRQYLFLLCVMGIKMWVNHHSYLLKNGHHFGCGLPALFPTLLFHTASFAWSLKLKWSSLPWLSHLQKFPWYPYMLAMPPKNPVRKGTSISPLAVSAFLPATSHLCVIDKLL